MKKQKRETNQSLPLSSSDQNSLNDTFTPVFSEHQKVHLPLKHPQKPSTKFRFLRKMNQEIESGPPTLKDTLIPELEKLESLSEGSNEELVILPQKSPPGDLCINRS